MSLKDICVRVHVYPLCKNVLFKEMSKDIFASKFEYINEIRNKTAHSRSIISDYDISMLIDTIKDLCIEDSFRELEDYLDKEKYKIGDVSIPNSFYKTTTCINNVPAADYDLDGGFIGRRKEVNDLKKQLYSDLDRVITITGAGGLGKTALALKTVNSIMDDEEKNPYKYIIWFSAKENKLTAENGIVNLDSQITDYSTLLRDIADVLNIEYDEDYEDSDINDEIYNRFSESKSLLVIDNLETITDESIINFIKDIPRPSQVLITSRRGLGEIERRYQLTDFPMENAVVLFRIVAKEKNQKDLLNLSDETIQKLVLSVKCYPLLIKWSIGKTCLGMDINKAFDEINLGESEISKFVFDDTFELLSNDAKKILFAMIIYGNKPINSHLLQHFSSLKDDDFEDNIRDLINCSFIKAETNDSNGQLISSFDMLSLTRGFVEHKLNNDKTGIRNSLERIKQELIISSEETERIIFEDNKTLLERGIRTENEKLAFTYIKRADDYSFERSIEMADKYYEMAYNLAPTSWYVVTKYAKHKALTDHKEEAEILYKKAIEIEKNPKDLYYYAVHLRNNQRYGEAIELLQSALKIDDKFGDGLLEIGRNYTFLAEYEKANKIFEELLNLDNLNIKQKRVGYFYKADNYHRWSEIFQKEENYHSMLDYLNKSKDAVNQCLDINYRDRNGRKLKSKILRNYIIFCFKVDDIEKTKIYFNEIVRLRVVSELCKSIKEAYFYFSKKTKNPMTMIKPWLDKVHNLDYITAKENIEIKELEEFLNTKNLQASGVIKFIDYERRFGVIECEDNSSYTFHLRNANFFVKAGSEHIYENQKVAFNFGLHDGKKVAVEVTLVQE